MDREAALDKCLKTVKKEMLNNRLSKGSNTSFVTIEEDFHDEAFWACGSRFDYTKTEGEKNNG